MVRVGEGFIEGLCGNHGGRSGQGMGCEDGGGWACSGSEGLRGGQNNGLDLCRSDIFIIVSEMEGMREHTIDGTLRKV